MAPNGFDPDPVLGDRWCPKCGVEMEPIEAGADAPPFHHLQLCPACYLVMWTDQDGIHLRQGVPVNSGAHSRGELPWVCGEPKDC